jgi:hypothetical protein
MHVPSVVKRALVTLALGTTVALPVAGAVASTTVLTTAAPAVHQVLDTAVPVPLAKKAGGPTSLAVTTVAARYTVGYWCTGGGKTSFIPGGQWNTASRVFFHRMMYGMYSCRDGIK